MTRLAENSMKLASLIIACLVLAGTARAGDSADLKRFLCAIAGTWDNKRQAETDLVLSLDESNRHPRRAMHYIPVANPHIEGQLFAILNYSTDGLDGPVDRVSLHRFRWSGEIQRIVHEFIFLNDPDRWGDLKNDLAPLAKIEPADTRFNDDCAMYWLWSGDHFEGATVPGQCLTDSFTDEPVLVEGHGELWDPRLIRHDQIFTLYNEPIPVPGGASPEIFERATLTSANVDTQPKNAAAIEADLNCQ